MGFLDMKFSYIFSVLLFFINITSAHSQDTKNYFMNERLTVGGFARVSKIKPYVLSNSNSLRQFVDADMNNNGNRKAAKIAKRWLEKSPHANGLLLIDQGGIVFEGYKGLAKLNSEFYSQSIGKSLTSLAVGKALCGGLIKSLDDLASIYVPELAPNNNNQGKSTVRQLLMMSSGNWRTAISGQPKVTGGFGLNTQGKPAIALTWPTRLGEITVGDILWGDVWKRIENKNFSEPGKTFMYAAGDTLALSMVLERATGMSAAAYFEKTIWQYIGAENVARWAVDRNGSTLANAGFQARLKDWGRLAIWILEQHSSEGCFGEYLRQATKPQIKNAKLGAAGHSFDSYGYQWWTENKHAPGFWGLGFAGQFLGINPDSKKIIIKFAHQGDPGFYSIFRRWHE